MSDASASPAADFDPRAYRRALGRPHPHWGDGSLMAVAAGHAQAPEPFLSDPEYLHCLWIVMRTLLRRARRHAARRGTAPRGSGQSRST